MSLVSSAYQYLQQLLKLAPPGDALSQSPNSNWYKLMDALSQEAGRVDVNLNDFINEAFPDTTNVLLENWERVCGLPDECSDSGDTIDTRRANVLAKLRSRGGASIAYFLSVIDALGYSATITEYTGFIIGESIPATPLAESDWAFAWIITVPNSMPNHAGFECTINKLIPAHTKAIFNYV